MAGERKEHEQTDEAEVWGIANNSILLKHKVPLDKLMLQC